MKQCLLALLVIVFLCRQTCAIRRRRRRSCGAVNGGWSIWSNWGACSCNHNYGTGTRTRVRSCNHPAPSCGGAGCPGSGTDTGRCDNQCCKTTHGSWSNWSSWGSCSCNHVLGTGTNQRTRSCSSPKPSCGGLTCAGASNQVGNCDDKCCKTIDGGWNSWSPWSICNCNHTQGTGVSSRNRTCTSPSPTCFGKPCSGPTMEHMQCDGQCCKSVHGGWGEWGQWGSCQCDKYNRGTQSRDRVCSNPTPYCYGNDCHGNSTELKECNDYCCSLVHWGEWSLWESCKCGGNSTRTRSCLLLENCNTTCYGDKMDVKTCIKECYPAPFASTCNKPHTWALYGTCIHLSWLIISVTTITIVLGAVVIAVYLRRRRKYAVDKQKLINNNRTLECNVNNSTPLDNDESSHPSSSKPQQQSETVKPEVEDSFEIKNIYMPFSYTNKTAEWS